MSIADFASLLAKIAVPHEKVQLSKSAQSGTNGGCWVDGFALPPVAVVPTTAAACTRTTGASTVLQVGALGQQNGGSGALRLVSGRNGHIAQAAGNGFSTILCDRLSHQGGLSGTAGGAQTTNLPTAALTRYTDGVGVWIGLTIHTVVGTTGTTVTASYTNQAGTAGRTTVATVFGGTNFREPGRMLHLPLQAGDTGVKSVESVTLAASTTTVGNFGVVLFKPLVPIVVLHASYLSTMDPFLNMGGFLPEIVDDACLFPIFTSGITSATGHSNAEYWFAED